MHYRGPPVTALAKDVVYLGELFLPRDEMLSLGDLGQAEADRECNTGGIGTC